MKLNFFLMGFLVGFSVWNACSRVAGLYLGEHYKKKLHILIFEVLPKIPVYNSNPERELTLQAYDSDMIILRR